MSLISIIVPIYNVEKYIFKCVDSIINQTYKNIEIILVDDGSTDNSGTICDEYEKKDNRIKVIHKKNGGLSDARNVGIDKAKGDYLVFVDSDDWVSDKMIEYLYNNACKYKADIVQGDYIKAYTEYNCIKNIKEEINHYNSIGALNNLYEEECTKSVVVWNKIYKKDLFEEIRFPKGKLHEDEFTTYKLLHKAKNVVDSNIPIYYYRQREGSIMQSEFSEKRLHALEALIERKAYFKENNLGELEDKTTSLICTRLKGFYIKVKESNIPNKDKVLKDLKNKMKKNYILFIKNKGITTKGKITLTICILNDKLFLKIYKKYVSKDGLS